MEATHPRVLHSAGSQKRSRFASRFLFASLILLVSYNTALAVSLNEYREQIKRALNSLELLTQTEEGQTAADRAAFISVNIKTVREILPRTGKVEWQGKEFTVDNSWLDDALGEFEGMTDSDSRRARVLDRILERLKALAERLDEISSGQGPGAERDQTRQRLHAILERPEYTGTPRGETAIGRLWRSLTRWLESLFPRGPQVSPGRTRIFSLVARIFVVALAGVTLAYVFRMFAPYLWRNRGSKKKAKREARIVLGEVLRPDESSADLLAEAEGLARAGDLRAAIRKGYIALLVELGDRKIISLAQSKTNRDYLRAVREMDGLHRNMQGLTNSFEQHWYGLKPADENDWLAFRSGYREALR